MRIHPRFLLIGWMEMHLSGPTHLSPGRSLFYQLCPDVSLATVATFWLITVLEPPCSDCPGEQTQQHLWPPAAAHEDPRHQPSGAPLSGAGGSSPSHFLSRRQTACPPGDPTENSRPALTLSPSAAVVPEWIVPQCRPDLLLGLLPLWVLPHPERGLPWETPPEASLSLSFCCPRQLVPQARDRLPLSPEQRHGHPEQMKRGLSVSPQPGGPGRRRARP